MTLNDGSKDRQVMWCVVNGELIFNIDGKPQKDFQAVRGTLKLSEADELNLLKQCLAQWAPRGYEPKNGTKSAAIHIIKTDSGKGATRAFIGANFNHVDEYMRFDAEALTMAKIKEALGGAEDFLIDTTYLMIKHASSKLTTPCGTCRDELVHYSDTNSKVVCVPFLTPEEAQSTTLALAVTKPYAAQHKLSGDIPQCDTIGEVPTGHAYKMQMQEMLPLLEVPVSSLQWQGRITEAYYKLKSIPAGQLTELAHKAIMRGGALTELGEGHSLQAINHYMVDSINQAYAQHTEHEGHIDRIRMVVVVAVDKDGKSKCYSGISVMDKSLPEKPPADVAALMANLNERNVKEVFVMELEPERIEPSKKEPKKDTARYHRLDEPVDPEHSLHTFKGRTLDRLNKNSVQNPPEKGRVDIRNEAIKGRSMLHVIPYNDGNVSEKELKEGMVSKPIQDYYAHAYLNPKSGMSGTAPDACRC